LRDEVRILIFDDPAENEGVQRPSGNVTHVNPGRVHGQTRAAALRARDA
jgi:hypothetical protein